MAGLEIVLAKTTLVEDKIVPEQGETNGLDLATETTPKTEPAISEDSPKEVLENPSAEEEVADAIEDSEEVKKKDDKKDTEGPIEAPVQEPATGPENLPEEANAEEEKKVEAVEKETPEKKG